MNGSTCSDPGEQATMTTSLACSPSAVQLSSRPVRIAAISTPCVSPSTSVTLSSSTPASSAINAVMDSRIRGLLG